LFLAANLLALQSVGNLPYFIPVSSFVVCAYFAWYLIANLEVLRNLKTLRPGIPALLAVLPGAASFWMVYRFLKVGVDQLVNYNPGRARDGLTSLSMFLSYGGLTDLHKWTESVLNLSPWLDLTLYAGILLAPLLLCGVLGIDRRRCHFLFLIITLLLFTLATPVSVVLYRVWPGMMYFRHIGLVSPLVKVLLCFVAGIGFEFLFEQGKRSGWDMRKFAAIAAALGLVLCGFLALNVSQSETGIRAYVDRLSDPGVDRPLHAYEPQVLKARLKSSAALAFTGALILVVVPILLVRFEKSTRAWKLILTTVLAFAMADLYRFKFNTMLDRSDRIPAAARLIEKPSPLQYRTRRVTDLRQALVSNSRMQTTLRFNKALRLYFDGKTPRGAQYWSNNMLFMEDEAGSEFRVDSWLKPLDEFLRLNWQMPPGDTTTIPKAIDAGTLEFPSDYRGSAKAAGITADKIRFFSHAYALSGGDLAPLLTDTAYEGDLLFVELHHGALAGPLLEVWTSQQPLSSNDSLSAAYQVQQFDSNNLALHVSNPQPSPIWLFYSDVWHPLWSATVNGRSVPVYRANVAYKAILLERGENLVRFHFGSTLFSLLASLHAANAAFWIGAVVWMNCSILKRTSNKH
jgi:hypothetical protein